MGGGGGGGGGPWGGGGGMCGCGGVPIYYKSVPLDAAKFRLSRAFRIEELHYRIEAIT